MNLDEFLKEKRKKILLICRFNLEKGIRRRQRDIDEERILINFDFKRFKKMKKEGKFQIISDRRYRLRI
jgi:hypothetical protein